ncbi:hypothetical protein ABT336_13270 [Micromonospora sp. NPDC000207]|uniref:hypothetical protein n=1 Tax=Micromonospora sp. NPDC000207 TaxID=3154246 RepID=UPI0033259DED
MPPVMVASDDAPFAPVEPARGLTVDEVSMPGRVRVTADNGRAATFTPGAKTVAVTGPTRTFTEAKRVGPGTADTFDRTRTSRWGMSPYYGAWSTPVGGNDADYTVSGGAARVLVNTANVSRYTSLRDHDVVDYDARISVATSTMPAGAGNSFALTGNYTDTSNHYRYRVTFNTNGTVQLAIDRVVAGTSTVVAASVQVGTGYVAGQVWWIRAQSIGGEVRCRAWADGSAEPGTWQRTFTDTSPLGAGRIGIRAFTSTGAINNPVFIVGELEITSGRWANPPVVTHNQWVRLLPAPFATWTLETEQWLRGALTDTTPDMLARAMSYVTGQPFVFDARFGSGRRVLGQADYGPTLDSGSREEGSDWNDYIRTMGRYPHLAVPTEDINEIRQQDCLDCSGYLRMVFGYWGGIPMSLNDPADLNGLNLPRRSVQIGPSGPGVLVAAGSTEPPPLDDIQVGDVVAFNADAADDVAGDESGDIEQTDDHVGIYLGQDSSNNYLFLSSRKTVNGPTFSALGGNSFLNGTGTWAVSLRHIRRI